MSQVYGFRMKPGVSMHNNISRFEKLLANLKNFDEDIKDEVKAMILLHSLPEEYSHFMTALIYGKSVIVFKYVCTTMTSLEIRNNDKNSERASSEALVIRDWAMEKQKKRGGKNSRSKSRSRNIARDECVFCHEKGHWRKDCPNAQKRDVKEPAAANMARKDEDFDYSLSITPAAYVASSSEWILVVMGNNQPCRTMGIGTIRLKMFDRMVRELKEVRFVPTLKKNLIYVGTLKAKGYKITIEDGIMKFTHRAMVILQGVWRHNLYYLKGGTTNEANVVEAHSDTTKLWHVRLRHAGEKSLQTLMRHGLLKNKKFWAEAVSYTSHLVNRLPSTAIGGKTPMEMWSEKHAQDYNSLRIFGCLAYYHVKYGKLDPRARKAIFVEFKGGVKSFKFWDLEDKKFVCSRDVIFNEASMMKSSSSQQVENKTKEVLQQVEFDVTSYVPVSYTSKNGSIMEVTLRVEEDVVSSDVPQNEETIDNVDNDDFIATRRPRREIKKLRWLTKDMVLPKGKRVIGNKWVYTKKQGSPNQKTPRYKVRLVAKGFAQKEGIDYNEIFSPIVKHTYIRILLTLVAEYELKLAQLDVKTAFLHGDLEEEIYMIQPCGFRVAGKENHVCRSQEEHDYMARVLYASVVGSLMYVMVCTRPDISQPVSMDCGQQCVRYCDSDFAGDLDKRRSTTDYIFTLGGGPVSWRKYCIAPRRPVSLMSQGWRSSEVLVIADRYPSPLHVAADLLSQAITFSNLYAPEHLIVSAKDTEKWESIIENAGSMLFGEWTPESVGDYTSGTNHVLPTYGPFLDEASLTIASGASCGLSKALILLERDTALKTTATKVQPMTLPEPHQMLLHPMSSNRKPFSRASSLGRNDPLHHN
ncbi:Histidinol dehydrogenase [Citrus sinensis]|uniref:Histidinol dehydrogenase n=1 Tax=Citrus sinensis TaxID=2711 RepID=A0ACB8NQ89_CITSI|nr:Histidinol dehydrogenase [Citrus sinensis]